MLVMAEDGFWSPTDPSTVGRDTVKFFHDFAKAAALIDFKHEDTGPALGLILKALAYIVDPALEPDQIASSEVLLEKFDQVREELATDTRQVTRRFTSETTVGIDALERLDALNLVLRKSETRHHKIIDLACQISKPGVQRAFDRGDASVAASLKGVKQEFAAILKLASPAFRSIHATVIDSISSKLQEGVVSLARGKLELVSDQLGRALKPFLEFAQEVEKTKKRKNDGEAIAIMKLFDEQLGLVTLATAQEVGISTIGTDEDLQAWAQTVLQVKEVVSSLRDSIEIVKEFMKKGEGRKKRDADEDVSCNASVCSLCQKLQNKTLMSQHIGMKRPTGDNRDLVTYAVDEKGGICAMWEDFRSTMVLILQGLSRQSLRNIVGNEVFAMMAKAVVWVMAAVTNPEDDIDWLLKRCAGVIFAGHM